MESAKAAVSGLFGKAGYQTEESSETADAHRNVDAGDAEGVSSRPQTDASADAISTPARDEPSEIDSG